MQGTYISPSIKASNHIAQWNRLAIYGTDITKDVILEIFTKSSNDNIDWSEWTKIQNGQIQSPPRMFLQYKIEMTFPAEISPKIDRIMVTYIENPNAQLRLKTNNGDWIRHKTVYIEGEYTQIRVKSTTSPWIIGRIQS